MPLAEMIPIVSPWSFVQWEIDLLELFLKALGGFYYLVVVVDYFIKWVETEPLATISGKAVQKFMWKNIICRFGIPHVLVSDNGKQFLENLFKS